MNEPLNPPEPNLPSDSTPPPPPPPPFTPPPLPSQEPAMSPSTSAPTPSPAPAPRPPVYVPPPGVPAKKSSMPWILGGCGCLTLLLIIALVIGLSVYRASKKVSEFKSTIQQSIQSNQSSALTGPPSPKPGWNTYTNVKEKLPTGLQPNFVAFSFNYPKNFNLQPQSEVNFVKVEKYTAAGKGNTAENFAVGSTWFNPPDAQSDSLYDTLLDQLGQQLSGGFHNYKELTRIPETIDGVRSRAALFQADFNDAAGTMIYGKTIVVHPQGKKNGVTILLLGTSLSRDIKSADDLGVKGDSADILRSFRFL